LDEGVDEEGPCAFITDVRLSFFFFFNYDIAARLSTVDDD
jgi:hypothetical protein